MRIDLGTVSEDLSERIISETDYSILKSMHKAAAKADSLEAFEEAISNL